MSKKGHLEAGPGTHILVGRQQRDSGWQVKPATIYELMEGRLPS